MKKTIGLLMGLLMTFSIFAQDSLYAKIKEPDFSLEPALLNTDFSTTDLARENPEIKIIPKMSGTENSWVLKSPHSSFVISQQPIKLVVKHEPGTNPKDYYKLFKLEVNEKKGTRTCMYFKTDNSTLSLPVIKITKIKESVYMLALEKLEPGEYAIPAGQSLFTFRIE